MVVRPPSTTVVVVPGGNADDADADADIVLSLCLFFSFSSLLPSLPSSLLFPPRSPVRPPLLFRQQNRAMSEERHGHYSAIGRATYRSAPLVEIGGRRESSTPYRPRVSPHPSRRRPRDASSVLDSHLATSATDRLPGYIEFRRFLSRVGLA